MLETIREFGLEQLAASGESDAARRAHASAYLSLAAEAEPELSGPYQARWLDRLEVELDNLRGALGWAIETGDGELALHLAGALWPFWRIRGHVHDGRAWIERILAMPGVAGTPPDLRAKALEGLGTLATQMGDFAAAQTWLDESLMLRQGLGDRREIAAALQSFALLAQHQNAYDRSGSLFAESLEIARAEGDDEAVVVALNGLAIAVHGQGDLERAMTIYEEGLAVARRLGAPRFVAIALGNLGNLAAEQGDDERAIALYEESLARYREIGDQRGTAICLYSLGYQAVARGDTRAGDLLAEALAIFVELGDRSAIAETLDVLARAVAEHGEVITAARLLGATAVLRERFGIPQPTDPYYQDAVERAVTLVNTVLSGDEIAAVQRATRDFPLDQVVEEALAAVRGSISGDRTGSGSPSCANQW
jgi:tetratricopeptide (TPR) repeat protein